MRMLVDVGQVCADYQDHVLRNLSTRRLQLDELWSWIFCKNKNVTPKNAAKHPEAGVTDRLFDVADIVKLLEEAESRKAASMKEGCERRT
jgi:hypothetical protein